MLLKSNTLKNQVNLAEYCRTGNLTGVDGLTPNRVHTYRRLIFNIALDTLSTAYPITHKLLGDEAWREVVDEFYKNTTCTSPYVWKMPLDFYEFITNSALAKKLKTKYDFLLDLLHFEWVELDMYMMEDIEVAPFTNTGSLVDDTIIAHPESKIILLNYPVHLKPPNQITKKDKGQFYCLCFREPKDRKILFFNLSVYFAFVLEQIFKGVTVKNIVAEASKSMGMPENKILENTIPFLQDLQQKGFLAGFKKA